MSKWQDFVERLGRYFVIAAGLVFTIVAAVYALLLQLDWFFVATVATAIVMCVGFSWWSFRDSTLHRCIADKERNARIQAERRLDSISAENLQQLQLALERGIQIQWMTVLKEQLQLIKRVVDFTITSPYPLSVRTIKSDRGDLYIVAKLPDNAGQYLRDDDPFLLVDRRGGIRKEIATLVVNQNVQDGTAIFRVARPLDDSAVSAFRALAGKADMKVGIRDYKVEISVDVSAFRDVDIEAAIRLIEVMHGAPLLYSAEFTNASD